MSVLGEQQDSVRSLCPWHRCPAPCGRLLPARGRCMQAQRG